MRVWDNATVDPGRHTHESAVPPDAAILVFEVEQAILDAAAAIPIDLEYSDDGGAAWSPLASFIMTGGEMAALPRHTDGINHVNAGLPSYKEVDRLVRAVVTPDKRTTITADFVLIAVA